MTLHYHGTPISPRAALLGLAGRNFCVSHARPDDVAVAHDIGQSVMLDNGAFSVWRREAAPDWPGYYRWCERWLKAHTTWAVIPDVIDGSEAENDRLLAEWPHGPRGAPVWHVNESVARLSRLAETWPRVCIGSAGAFAKVGSALWHDRMTNVMNIFCGDGPAPCWLHMLRGMATVGCFYPFASVDSTDIARNHARPHNGAARMAARWDMVQTPAEWRIRPEQRELRELLAK